MRGSLIRLTAIIIPCVSFIIRSNFKDAIVCFILQLSIIGWIPASIWAVSETQDDSTKRRVENYLKNIREYKV